MKLAASLLFCWVDSGVLLVRYKYCADVKGSAYVE